MAPKPWKKVNIAFPSAVSVVSIPFSSSTELSVKALLAKNEEVRKLIGSEILEKEIQTLYALLYFPNTSFRFNKTFNALKQVKQRIYRLKHMKLDAALQELTEKCPNTVQRKLSMEAGECDIPSQPMLEWLCLKMLGGAQVMSCTLRCCSRAFSLSRQHMKLEFFAFLITRILSRLWVIARAILVSLSTLYQQLLELLREVANAHPMPFLTDFSLPADMAQFLSPSDAYILPKKTAHGPHAKDHKEKQQQEKRKKLPV
ncbi:nucleolus and neural progenitor protein, partial [Epinephelus moara]|uniref:nucleolus and neural progenitor protein n=1 Tax=Epinephelus moara TaxID=300413 RepID=UPI00214ED165